MHTQPRLSSFAVRYASESGLKAYRAVFERSIDGRRVKTSVVEAAPRLKETARHYCDQISHIGYDGREVDLMLIAVAKPL